MLARFRKGRLYQGSHVITLIQSMDLKAWYTCYHHRQSILKNVKRFSFYLKISIFFDFPYFLLCWTCHLEIVITNKPKISARYRIRLLTNQNLHFSASVFFFWNESVVKIFLYSEFCLDGIFLPEIFRRNFNRKVTGNWHF